MARTGGRQPGTPNKRTGEIEEKLKRLNCDPIAGMARLAMDETAPLAIRAAMFRELAAYVAPKRRAIELTCETDEPARADDARKSLAAKLEAIARRTVAAAEERYPLRERHFRNRYRSGISIFKAIAPCRAGKDEVLER